MTGTDQGRIAAILTLRPRSKGIMKGSQRTVAQVRLGLSGIRTLARRMAKRGYSRWLWGGRGLKFTSYSTEGLCREKCSESGEL